MSWSEDQLANHLARHGVPAGMSHVDTSSPPLAFPAGKPGGGRLALGRLKSGEMNKTEARYAGHLEEQRRAGIIAWFRFEAIKLRLADNTFYSPDFAVMLLDGVIEMHEVKGFWEDDARVKIKVAAGAYPLRFFCSEEKQVWLGIRGVLIMPAHKGCIALNRIDLSGQSFGHLTATGRRETRGKVIFWEGLCACGNLTWARSQSLRRGVTTHCGCKRCPTTCTHKMSGTPTYLSWLSMKARCSDISNKDYGGRGITVCDAWLNSFENFLADMGARPSKNYSLDRIDGDRNYEPSNCRWASRNIQNGNRRNVRKFDALGKQLAISEISERTGIKYGTLYKRLVLSGWTTERAMGA